MQIVRPHLPRLNATYVDDAAKEEAMEGEQMERRYYSMAEEVEFRWLVGRWLLGQRRLVEVRILNETVPRREMSGSLSPPSRFSGS